MAIGSNHWYVSHNTIVASDLPLQEIWYPSIPLGAGGNIVAAAVHDGMKLQKAINRKLIFISQSI